MSEKQLFFTKYQFLSSQFPYHDPAGDVLDGPEVEAEEQGHRHEHADVRRREERAEKVEEQRRETEKQVEKGHAGVLEGPRPALVVVSRELHPRERSKVNCTRVNSTCLESPFLLDVFCDDFADVFSEARKFFGTNSPNLPSQTVKIIRREKTEKVTFNVSNCPGSRWVGHSC